MIWIDGQRFEGDWKKDMMLKGRCRYPCGGEYYGEFNNDINNINKINHRS